MTADKGIRKSPEVFRLSSDLWDNNVSQSPRQPEQLQCVLQAQRSIVNDIIFHAVINVRYFANVVAAVLHAEVPLKFGPALQHELQCLTVIQLQV